MNSLLYLLYRFFPPAPGTAAYARALAEQNAQAEAAKRDKNRALWKQEFAESPQGAVVLEHILKAAARGDVEKYVTLVLDSKYDLLDVYPWAHPTVVGAEEYFKSLGYRCSYSSDNIKNGTVTIDIKW